jgi:hypothetical protein
MKFDDILNKTIKKVNEAMDVYTGIGLDKKQIDVGQYVVLFDDGEQITVDAESKFDAKNKASQQKPGKRPTDVKKNEAIGDPGETLIIKKQLDGMYVMVDCYGHRISGGKTPGELENWAKENGYRTRREFKEARIKELHNPIGNEIVPKVGDYVRPDRWNIGSSLKIGRESIDSFPGSQFTLTGKYGDYPVNVKVVPGRPSPLEGYRCKIEFVNDPGPSEFSRGWVIIK